LRGRRARYISPVRLYLTFSLLFFAVMAVAPSNANWQVTADDVSAPGAQEALHTAQEKMAEIRRDLPHQAPRVMFVLMPVFALTTWAFYRRAQPYYVPHLYYSIHFHAFVFLVFAVGKLLAFGGTVGNAIGQLLALVVFPYHYVALRRTFGGTRAQTAWKGTAIVVVYLLLLVSAFAALLLYLIRSAISGVDLHPS
jgi:hypothetical protein